MIMANKGYIKTWLSNWWDVFSHELKDIFSDGGVLLIYFVAGLAYPLLYNVVYLNGILSETPVAVVDEAACPDSRRFIREIEKSKLQPNASTWWKPRNSCRKGRSTG